VYLALLVAYVSVVKHMAEKPVPMPGDAPQPEAKPGKPGGSREAGTEGAAA
jgi:hypothetical protein